MNRRTRSAYRSADAYGGLSSVFASLDSLHGVGKAVIDSKLTFAGLGKILTFTTTVAVGQDTNILEFTGIVASNCSLQSARIALETNYPDNCIDFILINNGTEEVMLQDSIPFNGFASYPVYPGETAYLYTRAGQWLVEISGTEIVAWNTLRLRPTTYLYVGQQKLATYSDGVGAWKPFPIEWDGTAWRPCTEMPIVIGDATSSQTVLAATTGETAIFGDAPRYGSWRIPANLFGPNGLFSRFFLRGYLNVSNSSATIAGFAYRVYANALGGTRIANTSTVAVGAGLSSRLTRFDSELGWSPGATGFTNLTRVKSFSFALTSTGAITGNYFVQALYNEGTNIDWTVAHNLFPCVYIDNSASDCVLGNSNYSLVAQP